MSNEREEINAEAVEMTQRRGVKLMKMYSNPEKKLYVFSATKGGGKVGSAVWVYHGRGMLHAFTTGALAFDDNFDRSSGRLNWAVENFTFGYGKLKCEEYILLQLLNQPFETLQKIQTDNANPKNQDDQNFLQNVGAVMQCIQSTGNGHCELFADFFIGMLREGLRSTIKTCTDIGNKERDPIFLEQQRRLEAWGKTFDDESYNDPAKALHDFLKVKNIIVQCIPNLSAKVAKMGLGRCTLYKLISKQWEGEELRLHMWSVCFMRVFLLLSDPLSAYVFYMTNAFGKSDEFSKVDELWAHKRVSQKLSHRPDPGPLCDLLNDDQGRYADDIQELMCKTVPLPAFLTGYADNDKPKMLGVANSWVLYFLMAAAGGPSVQSQMQPSLFKQMESAKNFLKKCGWEKGVNEFRGAAGLFVANPVEGVFDSNLLPDKYARLIRTARLVDAEQFIDNVANALNGV